MHCAQVTQHAFRPEVVTKDRQDIWTLVTGELGECGVCGLFLLCPQNGHLLHSIRSKFYFLSTAPTQSIVLTHAVKSSHFIFFIF